MSEVEMLLDLHEQLGAAHSLEGSGQGGVCEQGMVSEPFERDVLGQETPDSWLEWTWQEVSPMNWFPGESLGSIPESAHEGVDIEFRLQDLGWDISGNVEGSHTSAGADQGPDWTNAQTDAGALQGLAASGRSSTFSEDSTYGVLLSGVTHLALLCLLMLSPVFFDSSGAGGNSNAPVIVKLLANEELTPQDESPASVDSLASMPSVAARVLANKQAGNDEAPHNDSASSETKEPLDRENTTDEFSGTISDSQSDNATEENSANKLSESKEPLEKFPEEESRKIDNVEVRTLSRHDSVGSSPSVASTDRRSSMESGRDGEEFKARIVSAIHQAAYFPRKAMKERRYGEAVVAFTVHRNGSISNLALKKHSGCKVLDEAALKIVLKASEKFPAIPDTFVTDAVSYEVPIIFKQKTS